MFSWILNTPHHESNFDRSNSLHVHQPDFHFYLWYQVWLFSLDTRRKLNVLGRSEDVQGVFSTSYLRSIYVLCPRDFRVKIKRYYCRQSPFLHYFFGYKKARLTSTSGSCKSDLHIFAVKNYIKAFHYHGTNHSSLFGFGYGKLVAVLTRQWTPFYCFSQI